jgi:hypothetical protein
VGSGSSPLSCGVFSSSMLDLLFTYYIENPFVIRSRNSGIFRGLFGYRYILEQFEKVALKGVQK